MYAKLIIHMQWTIFYIISTLQSDAESRAPANDRPSSSASDSAEIPPAPSPTPDGDPGSSSDESSGQASAAPPARVRHAPRPRQHAPRRQPEPWKDMDDWVPSNIPFTNQPGPAHGIDSEDPVDFLGLFLDDNLLDFLVTETNRYEEQTYRARRRTGTLKEHSRAHKWKPVSEDEMRKFLGLMFLTGIVQKPTIEMYWSTDDMLSTPYFATVMTRDRWVCELV